MNPIHPACTVYSVQLCTTVQWTLKQYSVCQSRKNQPLYLILSTLQAEWALKNVFFLQNLILYKVRKNIDEIAIRFDVLEINFSFAE
jgi:hypothetical protein